MGVQNWVGNRKWVFCRLLDPQTIERAPKKSFQALRQFRGKSNPQFGISEISMCLRWLHQSWEGQILEFCKREIVRWKLEDILYLEHFLISRNILQNPGPQNWKFLAPWKFIRKCVFRTFLKHNWANPGAKYLSVIKYGWISTESRPKKWVLYLSIDTHWCQNRTLSEFREPRRWGMLFPTRERRVPHCHRSQAVAEWLPEC